MNSFLNDTKTYAKNKNIGYNIFNLGSSFPIELKYFIRIIEKHTLKVANKNFLEMQPGDMESTFADSQKFNNTFGKIPITQIENGLLKFINWFIDYEEKKFY